MKKYNFNKLIASVIGLTLLQCAIMPSKAQAIIAEVAVGEWVMGMEQYFHLETSSARLDFLCILLLPLCVMEQKVHATPINVQALLDNGYTPNEASQISTESSALLAALAKNQQRLTIDSSDTPESLSKQIRTVMPEASDTFVNFYVSQALTQALKTR